MHRVGDSPSPNSKGAERVVKSGGVAPGGYHESEEEIEVRKQIYKMRGLEWKGDYEDSGMHRNITSFLKQLHDPSKGVDGKDFKSLVAWYYLAKFQGKPISSFASDGELVFRVPASWLKANVAACLEHRPRMAEDVPDRFPPFAFLTALVVPLEYRITDPTPYEKEVAMTTVDVQNMIHNAHVGIDAKLRNEQYYADYHSAKRAAEMECLKASRRENPFA
jgi:hypothetical protein